MILQPSAKASATRTAEEHQRVLDSPGGIDGTLIDWMLLLSPTQRMRVLQQAVRSLTELKRGRFRS